MAAAEQMQVQMEYGLAGALAAVQNGSVPIEKIPFAGELRRYKLQLVAAQLARERKLLAGYRTVLNNGTGAGQSVFHLHLHLLGGRNFRWPPG